MRATHKAETCVALMRGMARRADRAGQLTYADAKADFECRLAGLIAALSADRRRRACQACKTKLTSGVSVCSNLATCEQFTSPTRPDKGVMTNWQR